MSHLVVRLKGMGTAHGFLTLNLCSSGQAQQSSRRGLFKCLKRFNHVAMPTLL
jgi:hypothetical protein